MPSFPDDWAQHPETLPELPGPYDLLDPMIGQVVTLRVVKATLGRTVIIPKDKTGAKTVPILRIHLEVGSKPSLPPYWDVTAKHLIAGLLGYLRVAQPVYEFRLSWVSSGPAKRPQIEHVPRGL